MKLAALSPRFSSAEMIFSGKSFAAAMLAMLIANGAGLPRPFWSLLTAYVVANPLAGAVRSKALYRFLGTLIGSSAAVLLVPALSNAPELLTLALALWVGLCLFISLLDRTPRAYVFMLGGYTAALIGFPSVQAPLLIFDTAVARVEEIGLAILCATLVHSIVLPVGLTTTLLGLLDRTIGDARQWIRKLVGPEGRREQQDASKLAGERRQLAADLTQLRLLSTHVPFDTTHLRWTAGALREMQDRVAALTPTLSAVEDRLVALEKVQGTLAPDITAVLDLIGEWLQGQAPGGVNPVLAHDPESEARRVARREAVLQAIRPISLAAQDETMPSWERGLRIGLATRLEELVEGWRACAALRREIDAGLTGAPVAASRTGSLGNRVLHRDYGMALLSSFAAVLAICLCSAFWILTGWSSGSAAAMMAAVFCCFFAAMDDPVPSIHGFLEFTLWSMPLSIVYVLVLMPLVRDFGMLVAICAPVFLLLGCYMARPATGPQALALVFGVAGTLALHDTANTDIASFFNSMLGQVIGITVAARTTALVRTVGADWSARRIQRAIWTELGEMATSPRAPSAASANAYAVRMLDRIGLLAPRIALQGARADATVANDALRDLRVGADIVTLQNARAQLPSFAVGRVLAEVGSFFSRRGAGRTIRLPDSLLGDIDSSLGSALSAAQQASPEWRSGITALVGLRRNLFPDAPAALTVQGAST